MPGQSAKGTCDLGSETEFRKRDTEAHFLAPVEMRVSSNRLEEFTARRSSDAQDRGVMSTQPPQASHANRQTSRDIEDFSGNVDTADNQIDHEDDPVPLTDGLEMHTLMDLSAS